MQIWMNLVLGLQLLTAMVMIGLVLMQHGKGADMGASFGSGASGSLFGATGSANFLSRSTAVLATVFFVCTLALAYMGNVGGERPSGGSVLDRAAVPARAPSGAQIPGTGEPAATQNPGAGTQNPAGNAPIPGTSTPAVPASGAEIPR